MDDSKYQYKNEVNLFSKVKHNKSTGLNRLSSLLSTLFLEREWDVEVFLIERDGVHTYV